MDILEYRDYCLSLPFVEESTPFDETTLVFKVGGRMFTYAGMDDFRRLAVKCDPDEAVGLRERYEGVEASAIRTNVLGWTAVVDWACRLFERKRGGHLVVISSVGGLRGSGAAPAYNASKAYQINYAEGLRQRVAKSGLPVTITDIRPGLVDTAMAKGEGLFWVQPVAKTVRQILRAVERRCHVAVVTRRWRIAAWLLRHLPESLYLKM